MTVMRKGLVWFLVVERHAGPRQTLASRPQKHKHETPRGSIVDYVPEKVLVDDTTSPTHLTASVAAPKPGGSYAGHTHTHSLSLTLTHNQTKHMQRPRGFV